MTKCQVCRFFKYMVFGALLLCIPASADVKIQRLALISDRVTKLSNTPVWILLENHLSQAEGIQLVERAEITAVLQEQTLTFSGLKKTSHIIKLGQLLRADIVIILTLEEEGMGLLSKRQDRHRSPGSPLYRSHHYLQYDP